MRARAFAALIGGLALVAVPALLGATEAYPALADPVAPSDTPTARPFDGTATVGALFTSDATQEHSCTASVVTSPTRDLIITAAHCVSGTGAGMQFVPGYDNGDTPYGVWAVTEAYADPEWVASQDPTRDYAILRVAKHDNTGVEDVTGGALLGLAPTAGERVTSVAYNIGTDDQPITCSTPAYLTTSYPSFNCHDYVGGSSGSPWLTGVPGTRLAVVRGVIGGLYHGGCYDYTSYSSAFDAATYQVLLRAVTGVAPDTLPVDGADGC